jgi:tRNA (guanine37-N1)-methyltransferase
MTALCVRVDREDGEATRQALVAEGVLDGDRQIAVEDGDLYVPITDPESVPAEYEVVERETGERDRQQTPADVLGEEPTYERLGEIVVIDEDDPDRAREIADAIVSSDVPCQTVMNRASKVQGEFRVRDWEVLAGDGTETVHREYGHEFLLDVATVYFSPRLATERHRVIEQVESGELVVDMFAGVGPFAVPMATRGADVIGVDANPDAVRYLRENAERNGVADRVTGINADVRKIVDGVEDAETESVRRGFRDSADRLVANLPHSADEFLDTAVALAGDECVLHFYDIQHEDDRFGPGERAIREAAGEEYDVTVETRHTVRSYAPHELNVCLDVRLTRR